MIDILEDNRRRLYRELDVTSDDCFYWWPEAGANNIAITLWHMGRIFDVFFTQQAIGKLAEEACWFQHGWAAQTGYDPRGIGQNGWGMLTGYTQEDVAAMPRFTRKQLLGYLADMYDIIKAYLAKTPMEILQTAAVGFNGRFTKYQCIQMALLDNVRHLGEIFAIRESWKRQSIEVKS
ncbi:MAG: DinB family protein [Chloroflexi bacterium]|nr:DinB family protein [Chloroflexota bacterium]